MTVLVLTQAVLLVLTVLCVVGWKRIGCCPLRLMSCCIVLLSFAPHCVVVNALHQDNTVLLCFCTDKAWRKSTILIKIITFLYYLVNSIFLFHFKWCLTVCLKTCDCADIKVEESGAGRLCEPGGFSDVNAAAC